MKKKQIIYIYIYIYIYKANRKKFGEEYHFTIRLIR